MNTFKVYTPSFFINKGSSKSIFNIDCESVYPKSIHLLHQQIESIHHCIHKVFTHLFIFGGF